MRNKVLQHKLRFLTVTSLLVFVHWIQWFVLFFKYSEDIYSSHPFILRISLLNNFFSQSTESKLAMHSVSYFIIKSWIANNVLQFHRLFGMWHEMLRYYRFLVIFFFFTKGNKGRKLRETPCVKYYNFCLFASLTQRIIRIHDSSLLGRLIIYRSCYALLLLMFFCRLLENGYTFDNDSLFVLLFLFIQNDEAVTQITMRYMVFFLLHFMATSYTAKRIHRMVILYTLFSECNSNKWIHNEFIMN